MTKIFPLLFGFLMLACTNPKQEAVVENQKTPNKKVVEEKPVLENKIKPEKKLVEIKTTTKDYPWLSDYNPENALANRIPSPKNFERVQSEKGSFSAWLQGIPLKKEGSAVYYHDGSQKIRANVHHSVIDIDTGKRDLQQCADAVMRLKAEYHYSKQEYQKIYFNYTSGDKVAFDDWRKGKKPRVSGNSVSFSSPTGNTDNSYPNFKKYMLSIFNYAGTASLSKELPTIPTNEMQAGDTFIQGGFPGHAVMVMDMAVNPDTGKKVFLLAQSYMPAQDMHILVNPTNKKLSPWYELDFGSDLQTPEWGFYNAELKRFKK